MFVHVYMFPCINCNNFNNFRDSLTFKLEYIKMDDMSPLPPTVQNEAKRSEQAGLNCQKHLTLYLWHQITK